MYRQEGSPGKKSVRHDLAQLPQSLQLGSRGDAGRWLILDRGGLATSADIADAPGSGQSWVHGAAGKARSRVPGLDAST